MLFINRVKIKWIFIFTAAIAIVLAVVFFIRFDRASVDEQTAVVIDERNDAIYAALVSVGIENALVDVTDARTIIRYEVPRAINKKAALYYVIGAAARYAVPASTIIATLFENESASEESTVSVKDVLAFLNKEMTEKEFSGRINRKDLK